MKAEGKTTNGKWPEVSFGEIFEISSSKRVHEAQWETSGVPFYRAREIVKLAKEGTVHNELFISEDLFREYQTKYGVPKPGDLMISAVGTLGACYVVQPSDRFYYKDASVLRFSPKQPVCSRFIQHAFGTNHILDQVHAGSGSTVGTYTISRANETRIPLPPLAEQRRIAEVLDRAEALRAKRRAALAQLDSLTQSLFLDLFGDPRKKGSTGNTPTKPRLLGELTRIRTGKLDANAADEDGAHPFFTCAVEPLRINTPAFDCKAVLVAGNGDLNVKYFEGKFNAYQRTYVIESLDESVLVPKFLYAFLDLYVSELRKQAIGGVIKYIKLPYLTDAVVQLPSKEWQREFARRVTAVEALKASQRASLAELDALFATLQHRAFRGDL